VAYAENFHGERGFIQCHMGVIYIWCALFLTSQIDVIFMFPSIDVIFMFPDQRFGEIC